MDESEVMQRIMMEAAKNGVILWRNNSGALTDKEGRLVRYGLGNSSIKTNATFKSSDLIGIMPDGKFIAVECKRSDWNHKIVEGSREDAQWAFIKFINAHGGVAGFCSSVTEFEMLIGK